MQELDPKSVWLFFIKSFIIWTIISLIIVPQLFFALSSLDLINIGLPFSIFLALLISTVLIFIWSKLYYKYYKYQLAEDGFRKEYGVIAKKYVTIPYDRIQNVNIHRGLLARLLGLSELTIQTAGNSGIKGAEGMLPGLSTAVAEQLRDELIRRAKKPNLNRGI